MAGEVIYAFRVMRLPLLDAGGSEIGKIVDIVIVPGRPGNAPRVVGFVAISQRRRIFVNSARVAELDNDGVRLRSWDVDLHPFKRRPGEMLIAAELIDRTVRDETVSDIGLREVEDGRVRRWEVATIRLARRNSLRRRSNFRLAEWREVPELWAAPNEAAEAARLRDMHPSDVAGVVRALPLSQRRQLAAAMDDDRLADLLEELPEEEQLRLIEGLDLDRVVDVLDEMEYDDLADLLARDAAPAAHGDPRGDGRRRGRGRVAPALVRGGDGGRHAHPRDHHPRPDDTVAEALAQLRDPDWTPSIASQVFICQAPYARRPVASSVSCSCSACSASRRAWSSSRASTRSRACGPTRPTARCSRSSPRTTCSPCRSLDDAGRLLGAVSVDDVVDRMLGSGWRQRSRRRRDATRPEVTT